MIFMSIEFFQSDDYIKDFYNDNGKGSLFLKWYPVEEELLMS